MKPIHKLLECPECQISMKTKGEGCKEFYIECDLDCNFIDHVIEMEKKNV